MVLKGEPFDPWRLQLLLSLDRCPLLPAAPGLCVYMIACRELCVCVCMCVYVWCVFIKLHITAQSGPLFYATRTGSPKGH